MYVHIYRKIDNAINVFFYGVKLSAYWSLNRRWTLNCIQCIDDHSTLVEVFTFFGLILNVFLFIFRGYFIYKATRLSDKWSIIARISSTNVWVSLRWTNFKLYALWSTQRSPSMLQSQLFHYLDKQYSRIFFLTQFPMMVNTEESSNFDD